MHKVRDLIDMISPVGKPFGVEDSSRDGPFDLGENFRLGLKWVGSYADSCHP